MYLTCALLYTSFLLSSNSNSIDAILQSVVFACLAHLQPTTALCACLPCCLPSLLCLGYIHRLMKPNETQFSHPNGQRLQFSKPNIFEVDLHDDSIRTRYPPPSSSLSWPLFSLLATFFCVADIVYVGILCQECPCPRSRNHLRRRCPCPRKRQQLPHSVWACS